MKKWTIMMIAVMFAFVGAGVARAEHPAEGLLKVEDGKIKLAAEAAGYIGDFSETTPMYAACHFNGWLSNGPEFAASDRLKKTEFKKVGEWYEVPLAYVGKGRMGVLQIGDPGFRKARDHKWLPWEQLPGVDPKSGSMPTWLVKSPKGGGYEVDIKKLIK